MQYFTNCTTVEELKKEYRREAFHLHPDVEGGNSEKFREMVRQYEMKSKSILNYFSEVNGNKNNDTTASMETFKDLIDKLVKFANIEIEVCGSWLWVEGETKPIKDELKKLGFRWASKKLKWYYRPAEAKSTARKKSIGMEKIRMKYGSVKVPTRKCLV